jgi:hypothetical protein
VSHGRKISDRAQRHLNNMGTSFVGVEDLNELAHGPAGTKRDFVCFMICADVFDRGAGLFDYYGMVLEIGKCSHKGWDTPSPCQFCFGLMVAGRECLCKEI